MNATPTVSVVMSVYNDVGRVESAVASILSQTYSNLELIVVDDGSSDGSAQLLDQLAEGDARLSVLHQENTGLTRALVRGCAEARGEFIARQDSDDWSHPLRVAEQVALLEQDPRLGFVSCGTEYVGPHEEHLAFVMRPQNPEVATLGLLNDRQGPPAHGSVMFRKSSYVLVGGYREEFYYSQDSDLWLRMGEKSMIGYVSGVRYHHRKEADSISGAGRHRQAEFARLVHACRAARASGASEAEYLDAARILKQRIRDERLNPPVAGTAESIDITYLIGSQLARNGDKRARSYLRQVLQSRPWHIRAWVRLAQTWLAYVRR